MSRTVSISRLPGSTGSPPVSMLIQPPGSGSAVAEAVERANWLAPGGWMSIETGGDPVEPGSLEIDTVRDIGRVRITLLRRP